MGKLPPWPKVWESILALRPAVLDGLDLTPNEDGWISIRCPGHDDDTPSLRLNPESGGVRCMASCSPMSDVTNLNSLEDFILDRTTKRRRGKRPKDVVGDLAERRMLPRDWLIDTFGISAGAGGYSIPVDDPEVDPDIEIDYEIDGLKARQRHYQIKRGAWYDKDITSRPKYHWEPKLSKSGVKSQSLVYNLNRIRDKLPKEKLVYVCAGAPDVWIMQRAGFPAISFLAGEGNMPNQRAVNKLIEAGVKEVYVVYDVDPTGAEATEKLAVELAQAGLGVTTIQLPEDLGKGGDLTDLWLRVGADSDAFEQALHETEKRVWPAEDVPVRDAKRAERSRKTHESEGLPDECWVPPFDDYRASLKGNTAACNEYHFFALMNVIGAVLGRRAFVYQGKRLYPNQYTVLIGPTASFKSTANSRAVDLVEALYDKEDMGRLDGPRLTIEQAMGSPEGLLEAAVFADAKDADEREAIEVAMGWKQATADDGHTFDEEYLYEQPQRRLLIHQDEFCRLLSKATSGSGGAGFIPHLLTAFDCPKDIRLRTRKRPLVLINSCTSILSDSTLSKLSQYFDDIEWTSGFGNRIIFVDGHTVDPLPRTAPPDELLWMKVVDQIRDAFEALPWRGRGDQKLGNEFVLDERAGEVWDEQYLAWANGRRDSHAEDELAATERVQEYAMKFALIYAVMTENHKQTIVEEDVVLGWKAARYAETVTLALMGKLIDEKQARWQEQLKEYIAINQPIKKRVLQQHFRRIPAPQLRVILEALEEMGVVQNVARGYVMSDG